MTISLCHVPKKREREEQGKVYILFVDLKAVFDKVDRSNLWNTSRRRGVKEGLIKKIERSYEETEITIKTKGGYMESFITRGMRQECVMNSLLFNLYIAGLEIRK